MAAEPESRFTRATDLCPHPERWSSSDDESTEVEVSELLAGLVRGLQPDYVIETGTAYAQTTEAIGRALAANGHGRLVSLEVDGDRVDAARSQCEGLPVEVLCQSSLRYEPTGTVDLAFFDSDFAARVPEFLRYLPSMRAGTVVAFHDTAPGQGAGLFPDGRDLRAEVAHHLSGLARLVNLPTPRGITLGEVLDAATAPPDPTMAQRKG